MANKPRRAPRSSRLRSNRIKQISKSISRIRTNVPFRSRRIPADPPFRSMTFERTFTHRINIVNIPTSTTPGFHYPKDFWDPVTYVFNVKNPSASDLSLAITPNILLGIVTSYYAKTNVVTSLNSVKLWGPIREDIPIRMEFAPNEDDTQALSTGTDVGTATKRARIAFTSPQKFWLDSNSTINLVQVKFETSHIEQDYTKGVLTLGYLDVTISTRNNKGADKIYYSKKDGIHAPDA